MKGTRRRPDIALAVPRLVLLPLLLLPLLLAACRPAPPPKASQESLFAALPEGLLSSPIGLHGGCGAVHQATGSLSPKAQAYYDQGLACLGTFDWVNAARSFHGALAEDPSLAVAYSGLARAYLALEQPELARQALRQTFELPIGGSRGGFYCGPWIEFLLLEKDTERALAAAEACLERPSALAQVLGSSYRGEALLDLKRPAEARSALSQAQASLRRWTSTLGPVSTQKTLAAVAGRTVAILEAKLAVVDGSRRQREELLASLGEELAQGKSFDAWASGRGRLQELQGWAEAHQAPLSARRLAAALASLEDEATTSLAGTGSSGTGPASACH